MPKNPCGQIFLDANDRPKPGELRKLTWPTSYRTVEIHHHDAGQIWGKTGDLLILLSYNEHMYRVMTHKGVFFLTEEEVMDDTEGFA
jgi:hypothetical protein